MLSIDQAPLSPGSTPSQQTLFAHSIADKLSQDIAERCGLLTRRFGRKIELYVLDEDRHVNSDLLMRAECRHSHVRLLPDNADECHATRKIVASCLPAVLKRHKLPFRIKTVEIEEIDVYGFDGSKDHYGMNYALHIVLAR